MLEVDTISGIVSDNVHEDDKARQTAAAAAADDDDDKTPIIVSDDESISTYRRRCDCCKSTGVDSLIVSGFLSSLALLTVSTHYSVVLLET